MIRHKSKLILIATALFVVVALYAVLQRDTYITTNAMLVDDQNSAQLEGVKQYRANVGQTLKTTPPIMQVKTPTAEQTAAFTILAKSPRLKDMAYDANGAPYRIEVFQSYKLPDGQATGKLASCARQSCFRMDIFNFTLNTAVVAIANLHTKRLLVLQPSKAQPELSPHLTALATEIANNNPRVKEVFGQSGTPLMAGTKTSLEKTVCDKSNHLCVAPTYVLEDKKTALWVIVDLTDLKVVGTAWTKWDDKPEPLTERQLNTQAIDQSLCGKPVHEARGDWAFDYTLTGSDGLEIRNVTYKGQPVIASAKNVDWHVSYSTKDGFGYSDAVGCPVFSTAAVVPSGMPRVDEQNGNVVLSVDFKGEKWPEPCNYYYRQQFQMNNDGSLRVAVANVGRGCGDNGTYRPITRIELPASTNGLQQNNQPVSQETWWQPSPCKAGTSCPTLSYAIDHTTYDVIPGNGQFKDGGRGDNPYLYLSSVQPDRLEGQEDLLTIGSCCSSTHEQGPETFINGEPLVNKPVALWYVAQLKNSGRRGQEYCWASSHITRGELAVSEHPCYSGPLLKPRNR